MGERGEAWFTGLFAAHFDAVVRYAFRRVFDAGVATDLAQETFIVAWRRRREVPERELAWLYGVARNLVTNHRHRLRAGPEGGPRIEAVVRFDETAAEMVDVLRAIEALPERDQEILRLIAWEELELKEAAVALGCSKSAAAVRLHRARKRLQALLGTRMNGEVSHV
ncbi:RNA polymerase sigma factor [Dactylosporangium matsuzakiense]|uniref:Siderophore-interacting protein n=1 Tax=Dactylosporangium matsuzakiense TaxID=53360 RepID=A0A9W6NJH1_9ACTN|nr:sigma-70 family RNA polymerase sigma factor [Dactylosporangium matsuzakiense]UWZ45023.1 sigma-70 family RNA polymerase sigma factor [Dactylosporangium matsuzakiense]GLK99050.1 siderophore-interacting protein [Dactylosporangium matsuzakiense]